MKCSSPLALPPSASPLYRRHPCNYCPGCQQASVNLKSRPMCKAIITATARQLCRQHPLNLILPDQGLCLVCSPSSSCLLFGLHSSRGGSLWANSTPRAAASLALVTSEFSLNTTSCTSSQIKPWEWLTRLSRVCSDLSRTFQGSQRLTALANSVLPSRRSLGQHSFSP